MFVYSSALYYLWYLNSFIPFRNKEIVPQWGPFEFIFRHYSFHFLGFMLFECSLSRKKGAPNFSTSLNDQLFFFVITHVRRERGELVPPNIQAPSTFACLPIRLPWDPICRSFYWKFQLTEGWRLISHSLVSIWAEMECSILWLKLGYI